MKKIVLNLSSQIPQLFSGTHGQPVCWASECTVECDTVFADAFCMTSLKYGLPSLSAQMKLSFHVSITPVSLCTQLIQSCVPTSILALQQWLSDASFWCMSLSCLLAPVLLLCLIPPQQHFSFITEQPPLASPWPMFCILLSAFLHFLTLGFHVKTTSQKCLH